jgi:hypothetical protein
MKHDRQRLARIETEARVLARSGEYLTFFSIEAALLERGFLEARTLFANKWTQAEVDRLCNRATANFGVPR